MTELSKIDYAPVNAKVRVTETVEGTEAWYVVGEASKEITVSDSASSITITNRNKVNKVVYMEAEDTSEEDTTDTEGIDNYEVIDSSNNEKITITDAEVTSSSEATDETTGEPAISITVEVNSDGTLDLHSPKADETYVISYKGTEGEGDNKINVAGTITVYTYKVKSCNGRRTSAMSEASKIVTGLPVPDISVDVSTGKILLEVTPVDGAETYAFFRDGKEIGRSTDIF